ncbi:MAG: hypothetical protein ABW189_06590 [Rickettsiales bacterium]
MPFLPATTAPPNNTGPATVTEYHTITRYQCDKPECTHGLNETTPTSFVHVTYGTSVNDAPSSAIQKSPTTDRVPEETSATTRRCNPRDPAPGCSFESTVVSDSPTEPSTIASEAPEETTSPCGHPNDPYCEQTSSKTPASEPTPAPPANGTLPESPSGCDVTDPENVSCAAPAEPSTSADVPASEPTSEPPSTCDPADPESEDCASAIPTPEPTTMTVAPVPSNGTHLPTPTGGNGTIATATPTPSLQPSNGAAYVRLPLPVTVGLCVAALFAVL